MKRIIFLVLIAFTMFGCGKSDDGLKTVIKIDNMRFSKNEYEKAYQNSFFAKMPEGGRKAFLDVFVARKLMLKEAEKMNLDKDPKFLNDIQSFWEQSLLKNVLDKKSEEPSFQPSVSEDEIKDFYALHKDKEFEGKSFDQVKDQIDTFIFRNKQQQLVQLWIEDLSKKSAIDIDYEMLGISVPKNGGSDAK